MPNLFSTYAWVEVGLAWLCLLCCNVANKPAGHDVSIESSRMNRIEFEISTDRSTFERTGMGFNFLESAISLALKLNPRIGVSFSV
jgi:hypothetical protein